VTAPQHWHAGRARLDTSYVRPRRAVSRALETLWALELPRDQELDQLRGDAVVALERLSMALWERS
jgi:hypothetical protein